MTQLRSCCCAVVAVFGRSQQLEARKSVQKRVGQLFFGRPGVTLGVGQLDTVSGEKRQGLGSTDDLDTVICSTPLTIYALYR